MKNTSRKRYIPRVLASSLAALIMVAPAHAQEPAPGAQLLMPFKKQLMGALQKGMAEGPPAAIDVCRLQAPEIAANLSVDSVEIGRTSHRLRNPSNAGPDWAGRVLQNYLAQPASVQPQTVALEGGRSGYVEPIMTQPQCLACHGQDISPDVRAALEQHYPQDEATGFAAGELRGVFWVSYSDGQDGP
jgi:hypothetical protein